MAAAYAQHQLQQAQQHSQIADSLTAAQRDSVDKLVGVPNAEILPHMLPERRVFYERLVKLNEAHGENLNAPPQVSKTTVDLYKLYTAVRRRGGFIQVLI